MKTISLVAAMLLLLAVYSLNSVHGQDPVDPGIGDPYPLVNCVLSDEPLDEEYKTIDFQGREIRVCCSDCVTRFSEETDFRISEINRRLIEQQKPWYPLDKCIVTGKALGEGTIEHIFRNRLFRLSSLEAMAKLEKAPSQYFGELDLAVVEKQAKKYPLKTCVVSDKPLDDGAIDHVVANQLVRLAGYDQLAAFNENPGKYLAKIRDAK